MGSRSWWSALRSDWPNGIAFKDDEEPVLRALGNRLQPIRSRSIGVRCPLVKVGGTMGGGRAGCAYASCSVAVVVLTNMLKMIQRYSCIVLTSVRLLTLSRITYTSHPGSAKALSCTVPPTQKPTAGRRRAARWSKEVGELSCA